MNMRDEKAYSRGSNWWEKSSRVSLTKDFFNIKLYKVMKIENSCSTFRCVPNTYLKHARNDSEIFQRIKEEIYFSFLKDTQNVHIKSEN